MWNQEMFFEDQTLHKSEQSKDILLEGQKREKSRVKFEIFVEVGLFPASSRLQELHTSPTADMPRHQGL